MLLPPTKLFIALLKNHKDNLTKFFTYLILCAVACFPAQSSKAQDNDSLIIPYTIINSTPQNADVYVNDELKGETPLRFILKDSSEARVVIKLKGYLDYSFSLTGSNSLQRKDITLISKSGTVKNFPVANENGIRYFNKPRKWGFIALGGVITAVSGIAAYYYNTLAIERNDDYYLTGNPDDLTQKSKYNLIGGVSVAVLQLGLATMLYFLFGNN